MISVEQFVAHAKEHRERAGRPLVTLSYAQSIDGSIAARRGKPLALSCEESLVLSHRLRAAHDAVLVGIGTILADDPNLNVRMVQGKDPQPVILDSRVRFPLHASSLKNEFMPWIMTTEDVDHQRKKLLEGKGVRVLCMKPDRYGLVDLHETLKQLAADGINSLIVEGGARVITSFIFERLVDQLVIFITPTIVGGLHAVEHILLPDMAKKTDINKYFPTVHMRGYEKIGNDLVIWGTLVWMKQ